MNDFKVMKLFLDELILKVKDYIKKIKEDGEMTPRIERIGKVCNNNLCPKELMRTIYAENMEVLMGYLRKQ